MKIRNGESHPVLLGFVDDKMIRVWCPYCKDFHNHGWNHPEKNKTGDVEHRVAHCISHANSPFMDGGYYIGAFPSKEISKADK